MITNIGYAFDESEIVLQQLTENATDMGRFYIENKRKSDGKLVLEADLTVTVIRKYFLPVKHFKNEFSIYVEQLRKALLKYNLTTEQLWKFGQKLYFSNHKYVLIQGTESDEQFKWFYKLEEREQQNIMDSVAKVIIEVYQYLMDKQDQDISYDQAKNDFQHVLEKVDIGEMKVMMTQQYYQTPLLIAYDLGLSLTKIKNIIKRIGSTEKVTLTNAPESSYRSVMKRWNDYINEIFEYGKDIQVAYGETISWLAPTVFTNKHDVSKISGALVRTIKRDRSYPQFRKNAIQSFIGNRGPSGMLGTPDFNFLKSDPDLDKDRIDHWKSIFQDRPWTDEKDFEKQCPLEYQEFESLLIAHLSGMISDEKASNVVYYPMTLKMKIITYIVENPQEYALIDVIGMKNILRDYIYWSDKLGHDPHNVYLLSQMNRQLDDWLAKQQNNQKLDQETINALAGIVHKSDYFIDTDQDSEAIQKEIDKIINRFGK